MALGYLNELPVFFCLKNLYLIVYPGKKPGRG